jgi:hypothetical protein
MYALVVCYRFWPLSMLSNPCDASLSSSSIVILMFIPEYLM